MAVVSRLDLRHGFELGRPLVASLDWTKIVPAVAAFAAASTIGAAGGGYLPRAWWWAMLAAAALIGAALVGRRRVVLSRLEWATLATLAGFAAWLAASNYWSDIPASSPPEAERALLYVAALAAMLIGLDRDSLRPLLGGAVAGVTAVCAYGLGDYVISRPPLNPFEGKLLFEPVGYANAFGIYAVIAIVLVGGLAVYTRHWRGRAAALAALAVLVPTLYLTSSRGALIVLPVGALVMLYFGGRIGLRAALLLVLAAGIAASIALASSGLSLSALGHNRQHYWRVAWNDFQANPWLGSGAGSFGNYWLHHRPTTEFVRDAHSLYVTTLAELGPVGLALVILALALPLAALRGRREPLVGTAAGGYVAFVLHTGIDWDWQMPAVTLVGLLCGASLLVERRDEAAAGISARTRAVLIVLAALLAFFAASELNWLPAPW